MIVLVFSSCSFLGSTLYSFSFLDWFLWKFSRWCLVLLQLSENLVNLIGVLVFTVAIKTFLSQRSISDRYSWRPPPWCDGSLLTFPNQECIPLFYLHNSWHLALLNQRSYSTTGRRLFAIFRWITVFIKEAFFELKLYFKDFCFKIREHFFFFEVFCLFDFFYYQINLKSLENAF